MWSRVNGVKKSFGFESVKTGTLKPHSTHDSTALHYKEMGTHSVCSADHTDTAARLDFTANNNHNTSYSSHT
jgi:hypothetical protein